MTLLILVRHGETDWNAQRRFQGNTDLPLNKVGRRQASALGRRLAQKEIQIVYTSDLRRAQETAEAIVGMRDLDVRPEPRLREIKFGDWQGLTYDEILERYPETLTAWQSDPLNVAPPGGESLAQLAARVGAALDDVTCAHQDETALLVAHGGSLQVLLCLAFGLAPERRWQFRLDAASVSELYLYPEGPVLTLLNDTCHLDERGSQSEKAAWEN